MIFLDNFYTFLLILHLLATFILVGSMTHNMVCVAGYIKGNFTNQKSEAFYAWVSLWAYIAVYIFGILIYPAYEVHIRKQLFDPQLPWATGLFEAKEHFAAFGLAMIVVYYFLRRSFNPQQEREKLYVYIPLCIMLNIILWYKVIVGIYLSIIRAHW